VDEKYGIIVNADTVSEASDSHQFSRQIQQAEETLGKECKTAVTDAGYSNLNDIQNILVQGVESSPAESRPATFRLINHLVKISSVMIRAITITSVLKTGF
jgi:hypothetical protein